MKRTKIHKPNRQKELDHSRCMGLHEKKYETEKRKGVSNGRNAKRHNQDMKEKLKSLNRRSHKICFSAVHGVNMSAMHDYCTLSYFYSSHAPVLLELKTVSQPFTETWHLSNCLWEVHVKITVKEKEQTHSKSGIILPYKLSGRP